MTAPSTARQENNNSYSQVEFNNNYLHEKNTRKQKIQKYKIQIQDVIVVSEL